MKYITAIILTFAYLGLLNVLVESGGSINYIDGICLAIGGTGLIYAITNKIFIINKKINQ